jgi:hypothetical protein
MGKTSVPGASYYFYKATQYYKKISGFRVGDIKRCGRKIVTQCGYRRFGGTSPIKMAVPVSSETLELLP